MLPKKPTLPKFKPLFSTSIFTFIFLFISNLLFLSLPSLVHAAGLADSPWPVSGYNAARQGRSPYTAIPDYATVKWVSFEMTAAPNSPVIGADGTVYTNNHDGAITYAINPIDGTKNWEYTTTASRTTGSTVASDGTIYVSGSDWKLHALNSDGTQAWEGSIGQNWIPTSIIGSDGTVYAGLGWGNHKVFAYNPDGSLKYTSALYTSGHSGATVGADGVVYVGGNDSGGSWPGFLAVNPDGSTKWTYSTGARVDSSPTVGDDGTIYFGSSTNSFYALNSDGTLKWSYATGGNIASTAAIGSDGTIYVGSNDKKLYAFNSDGTLKWSYETSSSFGWGFVSIDGNETIYVQPSVSKVYALNSSGTLKWSYDAGAGGAETNAIAIGDGVLYVPGGNTKKLIALQPWTLSAATNPSGYYKIGDTITITATTSMLQTDPSDPGEDNQVQAVMPNSDKVTLSYSSTNDNGNTVWIGTWTVPAGTIDGSYTGTVEAAAYKVETDVSVNFDSAPTGSSNTGITGTFSYTVDNTAPTGSMTINSGDTYTILPEVTLTLTATDATSGVSQMMVS